MSEPIQADATIDEVARILGFSAAKVRRLIDEYKVTATRANRWPLAAIVAAAIADARRDRTVDAVAEAEQRRVVAAADLAETEARARAGELVEKRFVNRVLDEFFEALIGELRTLPHEIAQKNIMTTGSAQIVADAFGRRLGARLRKAVRGMQP